MKEYCYVYYSTQRPVGPGTCPKEGLLEIYNFADKEMLPNGIRAWGYLRYDRMLTDQEIDDYELIADPINDLPDVVYCKDCEKHNRDIGDFKESKWMSNNEKKWLSIPFLDYKSDAACPEGWFAVEAMHSEEKKQILKLIQDAVEWLEEKSNEQDE